MEEDCWKCINYIKINAKLIYQKDTIGVPTGEGISCKIGQAVKVQLLQEADK